jgi:2-polyprenyl-6-methoxyphenol hydroxylase-like FAD-dependent oxidoreductase
MADVAVAGGGIVGVVTALFLARRGHRVVVLDADPDPVEGEPDGLFECWSRAGVPQSLHCHVFRGRVGTVLRQEAPDVLESMLARGIGVAGYDFGEGFEDALALLSRRPVFEAALRRAAHQEPGVELRAAVRVAGLDAVPGSVPRVVGVRTRDGERLHADLVIDCCGRRSTTPRWLAEIGTRLPVDHYQPCDLHYFARHYRLLPDAGFPGTCFPDGNLTPYGIFLAMAQDNRTFCLAGGLSKTDPYRSAFRDDAKFDQVMTALPGMAPWVQAGEPISDVQLMGGIANRRRSLLDADTPVVDGYLLIGDASMYTNATFGQGVALGCWQAQALARRSHLIGKDNRHLLHELEAWTSRTLGPRYARQVHVDEAMIHTLRAGIDGAPVMNPSDQASALAALRGHGDPLAAAAFHRIDNLLTEPGDELADQQLNERTTAFLASIPAGPGPLPRPTFEVSGPPFSGHMICG